MLRGKRIFSLLLILTLVIALAGCGQTEEPDDIDEPETPVEGSEEVDEEIKVAMVTDEGGINDQSFNQSAWEGLENAEEELGIEASFAESEQDADFEPNLETVYDAGNDLIWGIGYKLSDAVLEAAEANPDQKYGIIDHSYDDDGGTPDNIVGVLFKDEQSSFLVGYIAGKMTETNKVGFIGGIESDIIHAFDAGFQAGVKYANKDAEVLRQYVESFSDAAKAKGIATQMYNDGADIIFHAAGGAGDGLIEAAKEQDKWAIGVDRDQHYMAPENVLTSAMKRVDVAVYKIVEDLINGDYPGGETIVYGLEEDGVDIAPTSEENVPQELLDEVEELKQLIIDGEVEVPETLEDAENFIEELD